MNHAKNFSLSALAVLVLIIFTVINPDTGLDILAFLLIAFIILQKIFGEYFILILLAGRPAIDYWRDYNLISTRLFDINTNAAVAVFLLVWSVIFFIKNHQYFKQLPLKIPWLLFTIWCAASFFYTYNLVATITETIKLASLFGLFGICYIMTQKDQALFKNGFLKAATAAAIIPIAMGLYQFITRTGIDIDEVSNRIYGTFAHPNVLGTFALLLLIIVVREILATEQTQADLLDLKKDSSLKWATLFLLFIILLTYTRIAWIGSALLFLIIGFRYYKKLLAYTLGALLLVYILFFPINRYLVNNYNINLQSSPIVLRLTARNQDSDSIRWRTNLITKVLPLFKEKYLVGYGYGTFARVWDDNKDIENLWDNTSEAHNDYIKVAFESGVIGLALFLLIFVVLLYRQMSYATRHQWQNIVFVASIFIYLTLSLSDNMLHHTPVIWWFWAVWGHWEATQFKALNSKS